MFHQDCDSPVVLRSAGFACLQAELALQMLLLSPSAGFACLQAELALQMLLLSPRFQDYLEKMSESGLNPINFGNPDSDRQKVL